MPIPTTVQQLIERGPIAHVVTLNADGSPQVSMVTGQRNAYGLDEYVVLHGRARLTDGGAAELLQRLARTYLGPDVRFPPMPDPPPGWVIRITVDRIVGIGPWSVAG